MNLDQLRALVTLRAHGGLQRTAAALGVSAATLRKRLTALEDEVGVPLLARQGRALAFTAAGVELAAGGQAFIRDAESAIGRVASGSEALQGDFRVAIPVGLPPALLASVLGHGHRRHPDLRSHIHVVDRPMALLPHAADVAITFEPRPTEGPWLTARLLQVSEGLFASPDYLARHGTPQTVHGLARHRLFSWVPPADPPDAWPLRAGGVVGVRLSHCSADIGLMRHCALAGLGIVRLPTGLVPMPGNTLGALTAVLPASIGRPLALRAVMPDTPRMRRPFRAFFGNIREGVEGLADG